MGSVAIGHGLLLCHLAQGTPACLEFATYTHSALLPPLCGLLPLMDKLACRRATFLHSECEVVSFAARHGVYYRGVASPLSTSCNNLYLCVSMDFWPPYWGCSRHSGVQRWQYNVIDFYSTLSKFVWHCNTDHALPRLAAALYPCYLNCCLLNLDAFLFHVYLRMMSLMPLTLFALADCC